MPQTGARLRLIGTDPLQYRLLNARLRVDEAGIDVLGIVPNEVRTHELERAKSSVTPALGGESFGLVLAEAFACATPSVASDIPGLRRRRDARGRASRPAERPGCARGSRDRCAAPTSRAESRWARAARAHALANYAWDDIARRLEETYERGHGLMLRDPRLRVLLVVPLIAAGVALFIFRGPDWHLVHDAFTVVRWRWVIAAIGLNLLSVLARALCVGHDHQAVARPALSALPARLLRLLGRPVRECSAAGAGR